MRRITWLVIPFSFALAACEGAAFSAHSDTVAEAAGQELSAQRVADIMTSVKGVKISSQAADFVARLWTDYTLFAQAVADGTLKTDSAFISDAMWPAVAEYTAGHWMDSLLTARANVTPEVIDSAYQAGDVRVLQHVLIQVDPSATDADRALSKRKVEGLLARARRGADFGTLALNNTDDIATKADSGFLPPSPRGAFVPAFDSVAWELAPGELSDVVSTSYGFHIIRRASEEQAKARLATWLPGQLGPQVDKAYQAELDSLYQPEVASGAVARARDAFADLADASDDDDALATYKDGELTVGEFAHWIQAAVANPVQGPQRLAQMQTLPDSTIEAGILNVANRALFLKAAKDAGMELTAAQWDTISTQFQASVDSLKASIGLGPEVLDSTASLADRRRAAALRVDQFFDKMTSGQTQLRLLPGMLTWTLRKNAKAEINPGGIDRAVELAQAVQAAARDSGNANAGIAPPTAPGVIEQAPGGPPVPSGN